MKCSQIMPVFFFFNFVFGGKGCPQIMADTGTEFFARLLKIHRKMAIFQFLPTAFPGPATFGFTLTGGKPPPNQRLQLMFQTKTN